jgi:deoxyribose-phosphate aldolase
MLALFRRDDKDTPHMSKRPIRIAVGADHGGYELKTQLAGWLKSEGHNVTDVGTDSKEAVDYPVFAAAVARAVAAGRCDLGIMVDGAGIGSAMTANKIPGVRAAACYNEALAKNSRQHNGANVLTLGSGQTNFEQAKAIADVFIATECTEERHLRRVQMIKDLESGRAASPVMAAIKEMKLELSAQDVARIAERVKQIVGGQAGGGGGAAVANLSPAQLARMIDHTILKPEATQDDVKKLCEEALKHNFFSCCVNSSWVRYAAQILRGSSVKVCAVVGFPLGAAPPEIKALEARRAIREGAREIDMVINVGLVKSGDWDAVTRDIRAVAEACIDGRALLKVILETCLLTKDEIAKACEASMRARADYVKTSTGFNKGGATAEDIALMARTVKPKRLGVKASGGVRTYADAMLMIRNGATRIGSSNSVKMMEEAAAATGGK